MFKRYIPFAIGAVFALTLTSASTGRAKWRRVSPYSCYQHSAGNLSGVPASHSAAGGSQGSGLTAGMYKDGSNGYAAEFSCPLDSDSYFSLANLKGANVEVYISPNTGGAMALSPCVSYWGLNGGICDGGIFTGYDTGHRSYRPDISVIKNHPYDFAYMEILIPYGTSYNDIPNGTASQLNGIYLYD